MQKQDTQYAILTLMSLISSGERQAVPLALSVYRRVCQSSLPHRVHFGRKAKKKKEFFSIFQRHGKLSRRPAKEQPPADMSVYGLGYKKKAKMPHFALAAPIVLNVPTHSCKL